MKISVPQSSRSVRGTIFRVVIVFAFQTLAYSQSIVNWWVSSEDMSKTLSPQPDIVFAPVSHSDKALIRIDEKTIYQTIIGLGSSLEHSTCYNISLLPPTKQEQVVESIVSPTRGIGMNLMRICIGTPDFTASP